MVLALFTSFIHCILLYFVTPMPHRVVLHEPLTFDTRPFSPVLTPYGPGNEANCMHLKIGMLENPERSGTERNGTGSN